LAGGLGADNGREFVFSCETGDGFRGACGVLIHKQNNRAMKRLRAKPFRNHHDGFVAEGEAEHETIELDLA
jgi:hypothetical protein